MDSHFLLCERRLEHGFYGYTSTGTPSIHRSIGRSRGRTQVVHQSMAALHQQRVAARLWRSRHPFVSAYAIQ